MIMTDLQKRLQEKAAAYEEYTIGRSTASRR